MPIENERWQIIVKNLVNRTFETKIYDAVFVAIGHSSAPNIPEIPGASEFNGKMIHSHDFRDAERYRGSIIIDFRFGFPIIIKAFNQISR